MIKFVKGGIEMDVCNDVQAFPFLRNGWTKIDSEDSPAKEETSTDDIAPIKDAPAEEQKSTPSKRGRKPLNKAE